MPKLSIIIPTHNRPEMLENAIKSATSQTITDLEIIVVDDGSSQPVNISLLDSRVLIHRHESPKGASAARNTGISFASSKYIAFLDDDDTITPDFAERMVHFMETQGDEIDFAWPTLNVIDVARGSTHLDQNHTCLIRRSSAASESAYKAASYVRTTGMVFKTSSINTFSGFDESLSVSEDRELIFRMLSNNCGCGAVKIPLVNFYIHAGPRLSTNDNLLRQARCDGIIATRHSEFIAQHPKLASRYLNLLARRQKEAGLIDESRATLIQLLKIHPFDIRALKRLALLLVKPTRH